MLSLNRYNKIEKRLYHYYYSIVMQLTKSLKVISTEASANIIYFFYDGKNDMICTIDSSHVVDFVRLQISGTNVITEISKLYTGTFTHNIKHNKTFLYTETYDRFDAIISKFNDDFKPLWTKKINFLKDQPAYGIVSHITEKNVVINNGLQSFLLESNRNVAIGALNLEIESFRTVDEPLVRVTKRNCLYSFNDVEIYLTNFAYQLTNIANPIVKPITSVVENIYPHHIFELDKNCSAMQSKHLYLQAAGSLGQDSTKGIHLRWALKEGLSQHLPKADYATTAHNFNKKKRLCKDIQS